MGPDNGLFPIYFGETDPVYYNIRFKHSRSGCPKTSIYPCFASIDQS
jgi:hypothetical protein